MLETVIVVLLLAGLPFRRTDLGMAALYLASGLAALDVLIFLVALLFGMGRKS